jgi:PKD repeat protein
MPAVKEFQMKLRLLFVLLASLLVAASCGSGSGGGDEVLFKREKFEFNETQPVLEYGLEHAVPAPDIAISLDGVPGLDELPALERSASNAPEEFFRLGSQLANPLLVSNAIVSASSLLMSPDWVREADPPTSDLAWAIYGFKLTDYSEPGTLQLWWNSVIQPTGNLYIGVSDFSTNRWQWFLGPAGNSAMDFGSLAEFFSETDDIYFAVLLTGKGDYSLGQLRLGDNLAPTASFLVDVSSGEVPLTVNFDATASSDIDGEIISYAWDYEGEGTPGDPLPGPLSSHEYTQSGNFLVTLHVTDNEGAVRTAETVIVVSGIGGNVDPVANLQADVTSGPAPLSVNFDGSGSTDPDGSIAKYEWDLDGNGSFESDTGLVATNSHIYAADGTVLVKLRVTDNQGSTNTDTVSIEVGGVSGTAPPVAKLRVDYWFKVTNEDWNFDASGSTDPDDDIVKYEFDWNSDGTFDSDNGANPLISHPFGIGPQTITLRVTDSGGRTDTDTVSVLKGDGAPGVYHETEANDASTDADSLGGFMNYADRVSGWRGNLGVGGYDGSEEDWLVFDATQPGQVRLEVLFIDAEADIDIRLFNDDDLVNSVASSTGTTDNEVINYTLPETGLYYLRVYIFPSAPDKGPADYIFNGSYNHAPVANLTASPLSGPVPLNVDFDASGSFDQDGSIVKYEWDVDANGSYETDTGAVPTHSASISGGGVILSKVRVTDNEGATGTATIGITVINGAPTIDLQASPLVGNAPMTVTFDMSGSTDPDGHALTGFALDANGDGVYNVTGSNPVILWTYYTHGPLTAKVRVTDEYGAFSTQTVVVNPSVTYDEVENNDTYDTGNILPSLDFTGWFGNLGIGGPMDGDEKDWYKLVVPGAGTYTINMYFIDNISDLDMKLYDTNGTTQLDSSTSVTDNESIEYSFAAAGTYYLECYVFTSGSQLDPQDYMLEAMPSV